MMSGFRWSQRLLFVGFVGFVVAMALGVADPAIAGTYVIRNCNIPGERRTAVGPWRVNVNVGLSAHDNCATGGGFGLDSGPLQPGAAASVGVGTTAGIVIRRVRLWMIAKLAGSGSSLFATTQYANGAAAPPATGLFNPPGGDTLATPFSSPPLPADTNIFIVALSCSADAGVGCNPNSPDVIDIRGAEVTLEESVPPTGSVDGGELMASGPQSGLRSLAYTANDLQSGVARISVVVGNTEAGAADFSGTCQFVELAACQPARTGSIAVDTRKVADGLYPVSLRVTDAAGNVQTVEASSAIQVSNGAAASPTNSASLDASASLRLTVSFAATRRSTLTVGYGHRVVVRGRLVRDGGAAVSGAQVGVQRRPTPGGAPVVDSAVTTGNDGAFRFTVPRGATSSIITFGYPADPSATHVVSQQLRLRVKASARLRVAMNGIVVRYGGRVLSRPLPHSGKLVEIQGRAPGSGWKTFARRRTNRQGDFVGTYRLRVHRPGVRLRFRVRVPAERGYPFVAHAGRVLTRVVR